jgi:four helix bundle protein
VASISRFEDLEVWQLAREIALDIYNKTLTESFSRDFELLGQIRKSSGSTMDNIAEGFERGGKKEFIQFLGIAKGSAGEVRSQLYRAFDRKHIHQEEFDLYIERITTISKKLSNFISYLKSSDLKGFKFKESTKP